jgi:hypothetical protein
MISEPGIVNLKNKIEADLAQRVLPAIGKELISTLQEVLDDQIYWEYFEGKTTVRQNPAAKQPIAEGALRDTRDTDETFQSASFDVNGLQLDVFVEVDDPDGFYEQRPIFDHVLGRTSIGIEAGKYI